MLPSLRYFGDYELLEEVARGGMGVVYRARQISLDRTVALKMMRPGLLSSETEIERFRTEARTAARLQHPNIVAIHEVGEFDGLHYFSMDFVDGPSLADVVQAGPLSSAEAARYLRILAETLHYAHQHGVLHRDLKPSNILVTAEGQPRVTDFGLARPLEGDTASSAGRIAGTPAHMSPEQADGEREPLGPATDVYSLGAILYELLTGQPPFRGATPADTLRMVREQPPASPRSLNPSISREWEAICLKCLRKNPRERYSSAAALAADLAPERRGPIAGWAWAAAALAFLGLLVAARAWLRTAPLPTPAAPAAVFQTIPPASAPAAPSPAATPQPAPAELSPAAKPAPHASDTPVVEAAALPAPQAPAAAWKEFSIGPATANRSRFGPFGIRAEGVPMRRLLSKAFGLPEHRIVGPGWLDTERYAVTAVVDEPKTSQPLMQQELAERFHLRSHRETRDLAVFVLKPLQNGSAAAVPSSQPKLKMTGTVAEFAGFLADTIGRPVFDETGQASKIVAALCWTPGDMASLQAAVRQQLGMDLVEDTRPVELLIVDSIEKWQP